MAVYNIRQAKDHFLRLIAQAENGAEIIIARNGDPVARLVPFKKPAARRFGALAGRITLDDAFFDPLPEDEFAEREQ